MKLRDQLRTDKGTFYNWPPIWTHTRHDPTDKPKGEIGNLQQVWMGEDDIIFIAIEYQGRRYMGAMGFDDPRFVLADLHSLTVADRSFD
jgi:hypothetical protein